MDSILPSGEGNYVLLGHRGLPVKMLVAKYPPHKYSRSPAVTVEPRRPWDDVLTSPSTKDTVISLSMLILEYWELTVAFPEAAWTRKPLK